MTFRRNIVITGASSGLGEGMARQFAARGHHLALCARRTDRLDALATELRERHAGAVIVTRKLDVNDHDQVFTVFREFRAELGTLDRVIVNAGLGKGQPIGSGRFDANRDTVCTNFVAGLAQCEAALEILREQNAGHLVVVSSFSALRGMPRNLTAYAASKAGIAVLAEGIRVDTLDTPIAVTCLLPGYIESEMTGRAGRTPLLADAGQGARALVRAIEREPARAYVPALPWAPLSALVRVLPARLLRKLG
ncbi:Short-chain dehydrogenase [Amycolatopsis arida]|uniref:Short-chain dehydrogenase n=1 Tax=Amycolatopsis arida TaxID=587909 RepID=A0A1I5KXC2_9PSEU|nr:SDR family oxidoreductase [Amycolatopsis arida]TDX85856.1 short-subunit dehydrogenase [Amycolatopsis arida]SFO89101.1 Short-chain dehydrogenase [Amycolatopsis arida]